MDNDIPSRRVRLVETRTKVRFYSITPQQLSHFFESTHGYRDRTLAVWLLLLNAFRVSGGEDIEFTPKWRQGVAMSSVTMYRALDRLANAGLIAVVRRSGKSPIVKLREDSRE